jgi:hypothetical protein
MPDETPPRSSETAHSGGHGRGGGGYSSPLQARAAFFSNWNWQSVTDINRRACARGGAQHGTNSEAGRACAEEWNCERTTERSLLEGYDFLRSFHRKAPFLFFNGNTFAAIGRELTLALFSDLPAARKKEASSAVAHYIAGVLDREAMIAIVEGLCLATTLTAGTRVKSMRGSLHGVVTRVLDDGRVAVRPDGSTSELLSLPESLLPED